MYQSCQLLQDFLNGRRLPHGEWYGLALNLIHIKGGEELFKNTMYQYASQYDDMERKIEQVSWSNILNSNYSGHAIPIPNGITKKLKEIISVNGYQKFSSMECTLEHDERSIITLHTPEHGITSKLFHAIESECFYYHPDEDEDTIYFLYYRHLPACNCIVLSATANEMLYKKLPKNRLTSFTDMGQLPYQGRLELYADYSYSRFCLQQHPDLLPKIRAENSKTSVITFKEYRESGELYLGAAQGINYLTGKNLTVVGTFHRPEYVYKLWGLLLDGKEIADVPAVRRVTRNGFQFPFYTYENETLREIQLWMIESESEQAVGRARLVSNDCIVKLYSNFPLKQCDIIKNANDS